MMICAIGAVHPVGRGVAAAGVLCSSPPHRACSVHSGLKTVIAELPRTSPTASNKASLNITGRLVEAIGRPVRGEGGR